MKKLKKLLSLLICTAVIFAALPISGALTASAFSAYVDSSGNTYTYWTSGDDKVYIWRVSTSNSGSITIPATIAGDPVTVISNEAFMNCKGITKITLPDSITSIGHSAFMGCTSLTSINIPDGVTSIGYSAFENCTSLTGVSIPNSVTSIGIYAFYNCTRLKSMTIPNSITSITFKMFYNCTNLTSITISNSVTSIDNDAFTNCTSLTSITIPNSVTSIGKYAFANCTSLTSLTIPDSVTSIGKDAFDYCSSLQRVNINSLEAWCNISFFNYYSNPLYYADKLYLHGELVTNLVIPDNVTNIGNYAFSFDSSLTSLTITDTVTSIGKYAFYQCTGLKSVTILNSTASIGKYAFYQCTGLENVTILDSIASIGVGAFYDTAYYNNSSNWKNHVLYIGNHLIKAESSLGSNYSINEETISVAEGAFYSCTSLKSINVSENNQNYCSIDGVLFNKSKTQLIQYPIGKTDTVYIIPDSVTGIGNYAFFSCSKLINVTIPNSVTSIGEDAFYNCSNLIDVIIPNNVTDIGNYAFYECTALTDVYYAGTEAEWSEITIGSENTYLENADIHYNFIALIGELSGDGKVSADDLVSIRKLILTERTHINADINGDSTVNIKDLIALKKLLA